MTTYLYRSCLSGTAIVSHLRLRIFWLFTSIYDVTSLTSCDVCYYPPEDTLVAEVKGLNGLGSAIVCGKREGAGMGA